MDIRVTVDTAGTATVFFTIPLTTTITRSQLPRAPPIVRYPGHHGAGTPRVVQHDSGTGTPSPVEAALDSGNEYTSWAALMSTARPALTRVPRIADATTLSPHALYPVLSTPCTVPVATCPFTSQSHSTPVQTDSYGEKSLSHQSTRFIGGYFVCDSALFGAGGALSFAVRSRGFRISDASDPFDVSCSQSSRYRDGSQPR